jgi:predicted DNA-binding transcriptional regulator AlpA
MTSDGGKKSARRMLNIDQVLEIVPVARRTIIRMEKEGRFPKGTFITPNRKAWFEDEILDWQADLPNGRPPRKPYRRRKGK